MPDEEEKWFIRPHHIESLTNHARSIRDDFLNTNYYSHYNTDLIAPLKEHVIRDKVECLKMLQEYIKDLKSRQRAYMVHPTVNVDYDDLMKSEARAMDMYHNQLTDMFNSFMKDKTKQNAKKLVIDAYEAMNTI